MWRRRVMNVGDSLFAAAILVWIHSELTGGGRVDLGLFSLSNRGTDEVLIKALALLVIRHVLVPRPAVFTRVKAYLWPYTGQTPGDDRLWIDRLRPLTLVLLMVVVTRLAVFGAGWTSIVSADLSGNPARDEPLMHSKSAPLEFLQGRWDAGWYASIAIAGYEWNPAPPLAQQNVAFFPAFPMLIRGALQVAPEALGREVNVRAETLGALINVVLFGVALLLLGRLAEYEIGRALSNRAIVIAAVAPFSVFFSTAYTEALLFLSVVGAFLALRSGRVWWGVVCGTLAGLTKQTGFLLAIPLGMYAYTRWTADGRRRWAGYVTCALAPILGAAIYSGYLWWRFADPLIWVRAQAAWGGSERWMYLSSADSILLFASQVPYEAINLLSAVVVLPWIWRSRKIHPAYLVFGGFALAVPLIVNVIPLARMTVPIFPVYLALASRVTSRWAFGALVLMCFVLQLAVAWQFYGWRPLY